MEKWISIIGYEDLYQISNLMRVKGIKRNKIKSCFINGKVALFKNGIGKTFYIQQLYMIHFENYKPKSYFSNLIINDSKIIPISRRQLVQIIKYKESKSSKHSGVTQRTKTSKFTACIFISGKNRHLGNFINEKEASEIYQKAVKNINLFNGNSKDFRTILFSL